MNDKFNIKSLLTELLQFYVSLPLGKQKSDLAVVISMLKSEKTELKTVLLYIQGMIDNANSVKGADKTLREVNVVFWKHVLRIFLKYLNH